MPREVDAIRPWFDAAEGLGEYIGIRFGHLPPGAAQPDWFFLRHSDFDGVGGLAHLLRERGADPGRLPQLKHPAPAGKAALLRALPQYLRPRRRVKWGP